MALGSSGWAKGELNRFFSVLLSRLSLSWVDRAFCRAVITALSASACIGLAAPSGAEWVRDDKAAAPASRGGSAPFCLLLSLTESFSTECEGSW